MPGVFGARDLERGSVAISVFRLAGPDEIHSQRQMEQFESVCEVDASWLMHIHYDMYGYPFTYRNPRHALHVVHHARCHLLQ